MKTGWTGGGGADGGRGVLTWLVFADEVVLHVAAVVVPLVEIRPPGPRGRRRLVVHHHAGFCSTGGLVKVPVPATAAPTSGGGGSWGGSRIRSGSDQMERYLLHPGGEPEENLRSGPQIWLDLSVSCLPVRGGVLVMSHPPEGDGAPVGPAVPV